MKIWLLRPIDGCDEWNPWYDKAFGFVVCANSEQEAREAARIVRAAREQEAR